MVVSVIKVVAGDFEKAKNDFDSLCEILSKKRDALQVSYSTLSDEWTSISGDAFIAQSEKVIQDYSNIIKK